MEKIPEKIKEKIKYLPQKSGVYLMKDRDEKVIYVGKAKILKNRIKSYFSGTPADEKTKRLVKKIRNIEYIITNTEKEALILESNLIKHYKPHYNVMLKDDKEYPFIKITWKEPYPRIFITRNLEQDGNKYFGPYVDVKSVRRAVRMLEWIFPYRTCTRKIPENEIIWKRPCINHQLGKCPAPCIGKISKNDYRKIVYQIIHFLKGRNEIVKESLKVEMEKFSKNMQFEEAAKYRDRILNIQKFNRKQNMFFKDQKNRDVIGLYKEGTKAAVAVMKILSGKLLNKEIYAMDNVEEENSSEILAAFLKQYYAEKLAKLPYKIIIQEKPEEFLEINELLKKKLIIPQKGELKALQLISNENAFNYVEEQKLKYLRKSNRTIFPVKELKDKLNLKKLPRKMVCMDISTIQGVDTVSSIVFFENGKPKKKNYLHFIIKTVSGQDDFASMAETLQRYFTKLDNYVTPDLIVIDGGKGQLSSAYQIMIDMNIKDIEIIALAKRIEEVFQPKSKRSIILPRSSSALRLLIHIRDEAHRFAITFHRKRRKVRLLTSELDLIKGIGEKTKFLLLNEFGSVQGVRLASIEQLNNIKGIGKKMAEKIIQNLGIEKK
ncbi:MAG: excinuclease ABC subunit UvrC [Candidatus Cloacimonetes bacterium]|nr:excinuclease ABC subunit UvrC [Candidatus Cloacimonadota bacterium]